MNASLDGRDLHDYRGQFNLRFARLCSLTVAVLMPAGSSLELLAHREHFLTFLPIRVVASTLALCVYAVTRTRLGPKYPYLLGLVSLLIPAMSIELMIIVLGGHGSEYYVGLNLCIIACSIAFYWTVSETGIACGLILLIWLVPTLFETGPLDWALFYNNLYFLVLTAIIAVVSTYGRYNMMTKEFETQKELERFSERLQELDRIKTQFFANVSHELRTPLTLSLGPVEEMLVITRDPANRSRLEMVHKNQIRLLNLINDLLDMARLEAGRVQSVFKETDINGVLINLSALVQGAVKEREIDFVVDLPESSTLVYVDQSKFEKIVVNLLSNAFKFTRRGGNIVLSLVAEGDEAIIRVKDDGIGIPADKIDSIFDRFAQVDPSKTRKYAGTGIGLSLVKEYVELHGGVVLVQSVEGKGTTFTLRFKRGSMHLPDDEVAEVEDEEELSSAALSGPPRYIFEVPDSERDADTPTLAVDMLHHEVAPEEPISERAMRRVNVMHSELGRPRVLVVDDNSDMRRHIRSVLGGDFDVITARDGVDGLEAAQRIRPDAIVSDVMMPNMDGDELCRRIKASPGWLGRTPVILVTARADQRTKLEGLEHGADDYLFKPFHSAELRIKVRNLVRDRRKEKALYVAHQELDALQRATQEDLDVAREFQQGLLPRFDLPTRMRAYAGYRPAGPVGGDIYDVTRTGEHSVRLLVADITGHGVQAALRTMVLLGEYAALKQRNLDPAQILEELNRIFLVRYHGLVTCCALCMDLNLADDGVLQIHYAQAGNAPFAIVGPEGITEMCDGVGMILGLIPDYRHTVAEVRLEPGQRLFAYTDGLWEQGNGKQELFSEVGFMPALAESSGSGSIEGAVVGMLDAFDRFRGGAEQRDDLAIVGIEADGVH